MKAVIIDKYRSLDAIRIADVAEPTPKKNEVLVKVIATSVSSGDERIRTLNFKGLPIPSWLINPIMRLMIGMTKPRKIMGSALAGVIKEVGVGVDNFKVGDEIFAMSGFRFGAFAEYVALDPKHCMAKKPKKAGFEQAASLPFGGTTAQHFLRKAGLKKGQKVLIYGSTGAVGIAAVQVAVQSGAIVTAVCGSDGLDLSKKLGATYILDYQKTTLNQLPEKYDIIFDAVGHASKQSCKGILADGGSYISVLGTDSAKELTSDLENIARLYDAGKFIAVIDSTYSFKDIASAYQRVSTGHKKGSIVVVVE